MARIFGPYSPTVPLGTTWEEVFQLLQADGVSPVDLTGYAARLMIRSGPVSAFQGITGALPPPLLELTTNNFYTTPPTLWTSVPGPTILTAQPSWNGLYITSASGLINLAVAPNYLGLLSPTGIKVKLFYDLEVRTPNTAVAPPTEIGPIVWPSGVYTLPVLSGKIVITGRVTM